MSKHASGRIPWPTGNKWGVCSECGYRITYEDTGNMERTDDGETYHGRCIDQ